MKRNLTLVIAVFITITTTNLQKANAQWKFNGANIYNSNTGNVGVGTKNPATKLEVKTADNSWGIIHTNGSVSVGLYTGSSGGWLGTRSNSPLYFCTSLNNANNHAQMTLLTNGNLGVGTLNPTAKLYVTTADQATPATTAIYSRTDALGGIGITGEANNSATFPVPKGVQGICSNSAGWAGYFSGDLGYTGNLFDVSDQRLKENIKPINKMLDKVMLLKPSMYNFRSEYSKMNLPKGEQAGFIAQDIEKVFPQLVKTTAEKLSDKDKSFELKTVNYIGLIPLLTKAIQEQQEEISELKQEIKKLASNTVLSDNFSASKTINVSDAAISQNIPNPFSSSTSIQYNIPARFKSAQLVIADANGSVIKQVSINTAGKGNININAANLSSGTYTYSLFVDGKTIESKKMIVGK